MTTEDPEAGIMGKYEAGSGMYIVIVNTCFRYMRKTEVVDKEKGTEVKKSNCLNYSYEIEKWKELLEGTIHQLHIRENLEPRPVKECEPVKVKDNEVYFDDFIEFIKKEIEAKKPAFVFFYIASHGDEEGNFYLSTRGQGRKPWNENCADPDPNPPQDECSKFCMDLQRKKCPNLCDKCSELCQKSRRKHANALLNDGTKLYPGSSKCHRRNMEVLIRDIHNIDVLVGKPKIFVEQLCRGNRKEPGETVHLPTDGTPLNVGLGHPKNKPMMQVTLARQSDTLRLHATVVGRQAYLCGCSWLLEQVHSEAMRYKQTIPANPTTVVPFTFTPEQFKTVQTAADEINKLIGPQSYGGKLSKVYPEDLLDGWLTDLCRRVCFRVGLKVLPKELPADKQQPEFSSTLGRKLSCFDLFAPQK